MTQIHTPGPVCLRLQNQTCNHLLTITTWRSRGIRQSKTELTSTRPNLFFALSLSPPPPHSHRSSLYCGQNNLTNHTTDHVTPHIKPCNDILMRRHTGGLLHPDPQQISHFRYSVKTNLHARRLINPLGLFPRCPSARNTLNPYYKHWSGSLPSENLPEF